MYIISVCRDLLPVFTLFTLLASPEVNCRAACPHAGDGERARTVRKDVDLHTDSPQPEHVSSVLHQERAAVDTGFLHCLQIDYCFF